MNIVELIRIAIGTVRSNPLRTMLTLLSIAIGIFAIIGAGTSIASLNNSVSTEMVSLGQNTFAIIHQPTLSMGRKNRRKYWRRKPILYSQARQLKARLTDAQSVSIFISSLQYTIKAENLSTDPDVELQGTDPEYFVTNTINIAAGRAFSEQDIQLKRAVAIIGNDIVEKLFPHSSPLGKEILVRSHKCTVIGVLKSQGAVLGRSQDNQVMIPISLYMHAYANQERQSVKVYIKAANALAVPATIDESIGILRALRNVQPGENNDFEVETNASLSNQFSSFSQYLELFGWLSGGFALLAAGIGIMNIMLVSVKERTREIGIRKAIGATKRAIVVQFIAEAIVLCQFGGALGVVLGLTGGAILSSIVHLAFSIPWVWVVGSIAICTFLGIAFGLYPAWKAAQLDPIEALRYE